MINQSKIKESSSDGLPHVVAGSVSLPRDPFLSGADYGAPCSHAWPRRALSNAIHDARKVAAASNSFHCFRQPGRVERTRTRGISGDVDITGPGVCHHDRRHARTESADWRSFRVHPVPGRADLHRPTSVEAPVDAGFSVVVAVRSVPAARRDPRSASGHRRPAGKFTPPRSHSLPSAQPGGLHRTSRAILEPER